MSLPAPITGASSASRVTPVVGLGGRKKIERVFVFELDGTGSISHDITLVERFRATPRRMLVGPQGHGGTYGVNFSTTKLTANITSDTKNVNGVVTTILVAYDRT